MFTWRRLKNLLNKNERAGEMLRYYTLWGEKLRDTYEKVEELRRIPRSIQVIGMGGSGIVGYIIKDMVYGKGLPIDIHIFNSPNIPRHRIKKSLNILVSHSGNTIEVLEAAKLIKEVGGEAIIITSDGLMEDIADRYGWRLYKIEPAPLPRLALPQLIAPILKILRHRLRLGEIAKSSKRLDRYIRSQIMSRGGGEAFKISRALYGIKPVIYYTDGNESIAYRFKAMLNENSKHEAYTSYIPEIFHNQIEIYTSALDSLHTPYILMGDDIYTKILKEFLIRRRIYYIDWMPMKTRDILYRYLAGIALHDVTSIYLAVMKGVDPYTTPSISMYKELIREWSS